MKTKIKFSLIVLILITLISTISNATTNGITMTVVEEPICTINIGENSVFEKRLYSKNLNNKEVTIQLKVTNNEPTTKPSGEIMLILDNSRSMMEAVGDTTRKQVVVDSAAKLITNLLMDNNNLKIGAVSFSTNTDISKEGSIEDATLVSELTNDYEELLTAIGNIQYAGPRTDLDSALKMVKNHFSDSVDKAHKYVIILSDGVPNVAVNYDNIYFSDDVINKTKTELQSLSSVVGNNVYMMLTGVSNGSDLATGTTKTYDEIIEEIFGTATNPTIGKFYNIPDEKIEETVTEDIYNSLVPITKTLKDITIIDYIPKEIVDNFDFSYVKKPEIGTISETIDPNTNSITWTIPELNYGETSTVQYKLKLKANIDSKIIGVVLNTNTKVDLSYINTAGKQESKTSNVTPKLKLTSQEKLPAALPKAGKPIIITAVIILVVISCALGIRYYFIKKDVKK